MRNYQHASPSSKPARTPLALECEDDRCRRSDRDRTRRRLGVAGRAGAPEVHLDDTHLRSCRHRCHDHGPELRRTVVGPVRRTARPELHVGVVDQLPCGRTDGRDRGRCRFATSLRHEVGHRCSPRERQPSRLRRVTPLHRLPPGNVRFDECDADFGRRRLERFQRQRSRHRLQQLPQRHPDRHHRRPDHDLHRSQLRDQLHLRRRSLRRGRQPLHTLHPQRLDQLLLLTAAPTPAAAAPAAAASASAAPTRARRLHRGEHLRLRPGNDPHRHERPSGRATGRSPATARCRSRSSSTTPAPPVRTAPST